MNDVLSRLASCGCTWEQALNATKQFMSLTPPSCENDILLISLNPSLNRWQKKRLIKQIKRNIKGR